MSPRPFALACLALALVACKPSAPESPAATLPATQATAAPDPMAVPADAVKASMDKFLSAKSFHVTMHMEGAQAMTNEMDFVAPNRYRMQMPQVGTQIIIGDTMYMETNGRKVKIPLPAGTISQWRDPMKIQENKAGLSIEALGNETLDGQAASRYRVRNTLPEPSEFTLWIGENGLPLQLLQQGQSQGKPYTMTLHYSRFDDPTIAIDLPQQ